jgi:two-component system sensor histidine kinase HydH
MKIQSRTSVWIAAVLIWLLLSALTVFIILEMRDRAQLIRDNDNERLFNILFTSLRHYDDFGSAIESSELLKERIVGFGIYGEDLRPTYFWGTVPPRFDESLIRKYRSSKNGRYTIPDKRGHRIKFIIQSEKMMPAITPPPPLPQRRSTNPMPQPMKPWNNGEGQENSAMTRPDFTFFYTLTKGKYLYIDIAHPAYWRTQTFTAILFPVCELALLALVFFVCRLYLRNREYRKRIESQKNLVVLGTAASTLAHEIKNPLLSIRIQTGILEKIFAARGKEELGIINEEVDRLSALAYRINDYLRDAAGNPVPINCSELLAETARRLCGCNILDNGSYQNGMIYMDADRARSVIENLIRNAIESSSPSRDIGASVIRAGNNLTITVYDRGRGIASGDLKRVFDPFFTSKGTGTGIGLSISKRFVEAAGGSITLENREGGGVIASIIIKEWLPAEDDKE